MSYAVGSLVKARGREWVVLPGSSEELLLLRPLGGTNDEVAGIYTPLERVETASFALPDPAQVGDYFSACLLRDAVRFSFRAGAGPFRSFGRLGFEPRPYQLVPLLMALKLNPIRLLIADDVGIGKTIEAGLIARELLDRGEIERLAVLCPPALAEQWQVELSEKFNIEAELVLPSTAPRLERNLSMGESLFERYPFVVVSLDYVKSDRRREEFKRSCPPFVIIDEAHTCAFGAERGGRHQRYELVKGLAQDSQRHIILVTATPHSGNEDAFRSLLAFLDEGFKNLPEDLSGRENEPHRKRLAKHFILRRRQEIQHYLKSVTVFPQREDYEESYSLSEPYKRLLDQVLSYARETISDKSCSDVRQRVHWWSALALLRSLSSSPAAAAATLRNRAAMAEAEDLEEADEIGRHSILVVVMDESAEGSDVVPGSYVDEDDGGKPQRQRLLRMANEADNLKNADNKLKRAIILVKELLNDGYQPIVFCRFIPTAEYLAEALREQLSAEGAEVMAVSGNMPQERRIEIVQQLSQAPRRVLVATDCLSEGINLQEHFNAVLHYDLSWNPTRHEQRDGRVDRFGQPSPKVRVITYYGTDNKIDGVVLDVLLRKHRTIRNSLGISVPVPFDTEKVIEAIFEGLLLRADPKITQDPLHGFEEFFKPRQKELDNQWESAMQREKRARTLFAQETVKVEEVQRELLEVQSAVGSAADLARFAKRALDALGAQPAWVNGTDRLSAVIKDIPPTLKERLNQAARVDKPKPTITLSFSQPVKEGEYYLHRTHPFVETLANYVLETALDSRVSETEALMNARRCGAIRTLAVEKRTTLLLLRFRYHILQGRGANERTLLAEEARLLAFSGSPQNTVWLDEKEAEALLIAEPHGNIAPDQARDFVKKVVEDFDLLRPYLDQSAIQRSQELLDAHQRVRIGVATRQVEPQLPADVLGIYVYLPAR